MAIGRENLSVPSEVANHPRFVEMVSPDTPKHNLLRLIPIKVDDFLKNLLRFISHQRIIRTKRYFFEKVMICPSCPSALLVGK